jgi:hypothetical protein
MEAVIASDEGDEVFTESEWEEDEIDPPSSPACPSVNIIKNRSKPTRKRKAKLGVVRLSSTWQTTGSKLAERYGEY